ncbi:acyltransferase, partial [Oleiphilus sp. HI0117]|uniref:acyltransferase family protein n=1 Tax=Oleiphilus sp. HI0117 TaxID=1822261 RepID=UPI000B17E5A9
MVIGVHTSHSVGIIEGWLGYMAKYGQMGVQLFFVVSAYTLCMSFDRRSGESRPLLSFYTRRFFRIVPVYYLGIIGYFTYRSLMASIKAGDLVIPEQYSVLNTAANVFFLHGLFPPANNSIVPGGWSIGTEMLFYLCFPLLFVFFNRRATSLLVSIAPLLVLFTVYFVFYFGNVLIANNSFVYFSLLNQAPVFLVGIALYFFLNRGTIDVNRLQLRSVIGLALCICCLTWASIYVGWFVGDD